MCPAEEDGAVPRWQVIFRSADGLSQLLSYLTAPKNQYHTHTRTHTFATFKAA